jgi:ABC-type uncharacterized transport system permease subunit
MKPTPHQRHVNLARLLANAAVPVLAIVTALIVASVAIIMADSNPFKAYEIGRASCRERV